MTSYSIESIHTIRDEVSRNYGCTFTPHRIVKNVTPFYQFRERSLFKYTMALFGPAIGRSSLKFTLRRFLLRASCVRERGKEISKDREECTRIRNDATKYRWRRIVRHAGARVSRKTYNRRSRYIRLVYIS